MKSLEEELIDKDDTQTDPKKGINHLKVSSQNLLLLPGAFPHWAEEINLRKQEIQEFSKRSLLDVATSLFSKAQVSDGASGNDIAQYYSIPPIQKLVQKLKQDPNDFQARIRLVEVVATSKKEIPLEGWRALLLQASVALSHGHFSVQNIQIALQVQKQYLLQSQAKCRHDSRLLELRINAPSNESKISDEAKQSYEKIKKKVDSHLAVIRRYLDHTEKGKDSLKFQFEGMFNIDYLEEAAIMDQQEKKIAKNQIFSRLNVIINYLRFHTLMFKNLYKLTDQLIQLDKDNPIGDYLKGRTQLSELILRVSRFQESDNLEASKKEIQLLFKQCYHHYSQAVRKVGGNYEEGRTEVGILVEYVGSLRYFISVVSKVIRLKLPPDWVVDNLTRAKLILKQAELDDSRIVKLQNQIDLDIKAWR